MLKALLICIQDYRQTPNRLLVIFFECDIEKSLQGVARLHLKDVPTSNFSGVQNLYIQSGSVEVENIESEFGGASRDRKARDSENRQVIDFVENPTMPDYNSDAINSAHHHR